MHRTTILLPEDLKISAESYARRQGISLGELIRRQLRAMSGSVRARKRRNDPLFRHYAAIRTPSSEATGDVALNHDKYLAEAMKSEIRRWR